MLISTVIIIILITLFVNRYLILEYDMGLLELSTASHGLTNEEKIWLKNHGDLIYGSDNNSPPLRFIDDKNGQYRGVTVDYLAALSLELGVNIKVEPMIWSDALDSLEEGKTDLCDMYPSDERGEVYDFSKPIYFQRSIIISFWDTSILNYKDLTSKRVASQKGDYAHNYLESLDIDIDFTYTNDYEEAIALLIQGKVDAIIGDEPVLSYFLDKENLRDRIVIAPEPIFEGECILAIPKDEKLLLSIVNKGIYRLKRKDVMTRIQQKWFGISHPITDGRNNDTLNLVVSFLVICIVVTLIVFYIWNSRLKNEVERRTEELRVSQSDLEKTFNSVTDLMIVINEDCIITNVNRAFCKSVKMRYKDLIGRHCESFLREVSGEDEICIIKETLRTGKNLRKESKRKGKVYEISSFALEDKDGIVDRVLIMMQDITESKIRDRQILQSNKMVAVGQLAAGVAHEIRNPLGIIRNSTYILNKNNEFNQERVHEAVDMINQSVDRASGIIDNLLNFSSISPCNKERVNMLNLVQGIFKLYTKPFLNKGIENEILCDSYLSCVINADALKHILINLLSNSIDAMNDGGKVSIKVRTDEEQLIIKYTDNGMGISEEHMDKIFNPFYTTKKPGKGTGLGLYIVYNEIEKLNGSIDVNSELGVGTSFEITIPLKGDTYYEK